MSRKPPHRRDKKHQHIAAECPKCEKPMGQPIIAWDGKAEGEKGGLRDLACACCGHHWHEEDDLEVADAWYGFGASEALYQNGHI